MAFTFTVEDGTGLAAATSYVSVSYADDYFATVPLATDWSALTTENKEFYLAWASRTLDQKTRWRGTKTVPASGLDWPRKGVSDKNGEVLSSVLLPKQLTQAVCELARFLISYDPTVGSGVEHIRRVMVDAVEIEYQEDTSQNDWPILINQIIEPLGTFRNGASTYGKIYRA